MTLAAGSPVQITLPTPALRGLVSSYWIIRDAAGVHAGQPIHTSPLPFAVLSVNLGVPNRCDEGTAVPRTSLLGLQSRVRRWDSGPDTHFVMAMLTVPGVVRLFPHAGASAGALVELGGVLGDRDARALADRADGARTPSELAAVLDAWLLARREAVAAPPRHAELVHAHALLCAGRRVEATAAAIGVHRRQLVRWFDAHLGVSPHAVVELERMHASLLAAQRRSGDALAGFADQAHQIRSWRRRFGLTPGAYARGGPSVLARASADAEPGAPAFYL